MSLNVLEEFADELDTTTRLGVVKDMERSPLEVHDSLVVYMDSYCSWFCMDPMSFQIAMVGVVMA